MHQLNPRCPGASVGAAAPSPCVLPAYEADAPLPQRAKAALLTDVGGHYEHAGAGQIARRAALDVARALSSDTSNQKVALLPGVESTPIVPSIKVTMRLQMAGPGRCRRRCVVDASVCENGWNRCAAASRMPMPVSRTSSGACCGCGSRRLGDVHTDAAAIGELDGALLTRLVSTWRSRPGRRAPPAGLDRSQGPARSWPRRSFQQPQALMASS